APLEALAMTLGSAFVELHGALEELARAVRQVRVHIDDAPRQPALADPFTYGADDIEGWVAEAIAAAGEAVERIAGGPELDEGRSEWRFRAHSGRLRAMSGQ